MVQVDILGPAEIRKPDGELAQSFLTGPKRLALLVYLLLKRPFGYIRRDSLLPLFWPEMGQKSARNSLSNILYHIRKTFGNDAILNRGGEEIQLNRELFECDVQNFERLIKSNKVTEAMNLYRGDLLKGFYVSQTSAEFEFWLENERQRLKNMAGTSVSEYIKSLINSGNTKDLQTYTRRSLELNIPEESDCIHWVSSLMSFGEVQLAQNVYREFLNNYYAEYEEEPSERFIKTIQELQNGNGFNNGEISHNQVKKSPKIKNRIAVLPFESIGMQDVSTLTQAIHSDILIKLSALAGLHVISRTSVLQYKEANDSVPEIAERLKVNWMVAGEVIEMTGTIKINVRLINAEEDRQVWAETYLRKLNVDNIFKIQEEITSKITDSLKLKLDAGEKEKIGKSPANNLEAYCLCAQARWHFDQRTENGIRTAINLFKKSLELDPAYALAYVGLADSIILLQDYGYVSYNDKMMNEARTAALKAKELEPDLAETYATLGLLWGDKGRVDKTIKDLKKAIKKRPSYSDAYNWLGWSYNITGEPDLALVNSTKAVELNPLSPEAISNLSLAHLINGNFKTSIRQARQIQVLNAEWTTSYFYEAVGLYHIEKYEEAKPLLEELKVGWAGNGVDNLKALIHFQLNEMDQLNNLVQNFKEIKDHFGLALIYAAKNQPDSALSELGKIKKWDYWSSIAIFSLFKKELSVITGSQEFSAIKQQAKRYWGV
ncbi:hypothetical protein [Christiangramia aquimixticola]|uniref:hypothetical protein n=1 Tax=Christiangramia aquimixticola TaxID=1697558 RepID=UPI003AA8E2C3